MPRQPPRPLSRARAASCALINLAATPGLGSLIARRVFAGTGQLLLALAGFVLIVGWIFELCYRVFLQQLGETVPPDSSGWMWKWGLLLFSAGWLWSLVTSLSLLRQAKADGQVESKPIPPRMTDLPGQPPKQP
ncbi:MAG: hypothetical protein ABSH11_02065 [Verrucomicrobiota bacterium]|jgi:hypothetical protein